jgi:superfamily II DNA or RNA helicase
MSLLDTSFSPIMTTSDHNIPDGFFSEALKHSTKYDRGVGYFSAGWLQMVARGLTHFAENGGQARIITSPLLTDADWNALQSGEEAKHDEILKQALLDTVQDLRQALSRDVRAALSWLVADGVLSFKLAVPQNQLAGEFHDKFGIFTDRDENQISFNGSNNETINGTLHNYESFTIFNNWTDAYIPMVQNHAQRFERLWSNEDSNLRVYNLPEAARQAIIRVRDEGDPRPYNLPSRLKAHYSGYFSAELWDHQNEAIRAWEENNRHGILAMATGSGKTRTAIAAAERCPELMMLVIVAPKNELVKQWQKELSTYTNLPEPILVFEESYQWQDLLFNKVLQGHYTDWQQPLVVIGSLKSISSDRFLSIMDDATVPIKTMIIVDEVHNVGAPSYRKILRDDFMWRLGLSATPERPFDELGSQTIMNYFSGTVYEYSMARALSEGRLTPYNYYVYPAYLSSDEYDEYQHLTRKIISARNRADKDAITYYTNQAVDGDGENVERLLFQRANILKECADKRNALDAVLKKHPPQRCLIYCADVDQLEEMSKVLNQQQIIHQKYIGRTESTQRISALDAIAQKRIPALLAIKCLDEGIDVPSVDQAVLVASSTNKREFIQRRGRILRKSPDKKIATMIDIIALPPQSTGFGGRNMLMGELARATHIAQLAKNHHSCLLKIEEYVQPYGVKLTELLSHGENNG